MTIREINNNDKNRIIKTPNIISNDNIKDILEKRGVVDKLYDKKYYNKFSRFGYFDPYNALYGTREYLFFTKPMLNLFNGNDIQSLNPSLQNVPYFIEMMDRYPDVMQQLKQVGRSPFMNILSNSVRSPLDLPAVSSRDIETSVNMYGSRIFYKRSSYSSDEQFDFSLDFEDSKYLEVYNLLKIYDEYERLKDIGRVGPEDIYRKNKILHDQFSIYKFVTDEDASSIIYYAKMTGCFFTNLPRETFSDTSSISGSIKHSVQFKATFVEDMNPVIINEFNTISRRSLSGSEVDYYITPTSKLDVTTPHIINQEWATSPYIVLQESNKHSYKYMLKWYK